MLEHFSYSWNEDRCNIHNIVSPWLSWNAYTQSLAEIIVGVAKYEFCNKPAAATTLIYSGVPEDHKRFWSELGTDGINAVYTSLTVTSDKILKIIDCDCQNPAEERILLYLISLIGTNDLQNFLRFTTGSSVCVVQSIKIIFNTSLVLRDSLMHIRAPTLWYAILGDTNNKWKWRMDGYWSSIWECNSCSSNT